MHSYIEVSKFIQDDKTLNKVSSFILSTELTGTILTHNFKLENSDYRLISTNNGSVTLEFYTTYEFNVDSVSNSKSFFKPIGFFYFDKPLHLAFTVLKEFDIISLKQDDLFSKTQKRINIYRSSQILWDTIIACFSIEVKLAAATYFNFMTEDKIERVATPDSLFMTYTFKKPLKVNGLDIKFLTTNDFKVIQIYLLNNPEVNYPIAAYLNKDQIKILPNLKDKYEHIAASKLLTAETA